MNMMDEYKLFEDLMFKVHFEVKKIRGKNEYDVYRNYIHDLPRYKIENFFEENFYEDNLKGKDDSKSVNLRKKGNAVWDVKDFSTSLELYTKSLRYATYNGEAYAIALANRSAVYFALGDFKDCIHDIDLCLKASYPNELKAKVYIRKAHCFRMLGQPDEMQAVIKEVSEIINAATYLTIADKRNFEQKIDNLTKAEVHVAKSAENELNWIPTFEMNPTYLNASASVALKVNKNVGRHVIAKKHITQGDVLFVEKAYAFCPMYNDNKMVSKLNCQYCLQKLNSSVPCKKCVKYLYCTEECRDEGWKEFHQWECLAIQASLFALMCDVHLPLRIVLKGAHTGFPTTSGNLEQDLDNYGNADDNYPYVHKLCTHFENIKKKRLMVFAAYAAIVVHYLYERTNFFEWMKNQPHFAGKSLSDLTNKLGGLLIRHCAQIKCNGLVIKDLDNDTVARSEIVSTVLPSVLMISHSCIPNITYYFVGDTIVVKAMKDIKPNEQLYYSYMDMTYSSIPKSIRQPLLTENWRFKCRCLGCTDPKMDIGAFDSYLCIKCGGPASLVSSDEDFYKKCVCLDCHCQFRLPMEIITKEKLFTRYMARFAEKHDSVNDANRALELSKTIFNPSHRMIGNVYLALMDYYLTHSANLKEYIKYGHILKDYGYKRYGEYSFESGIFLYKLLLAILRVLTERVWVISEAYFDELLQDLKSFLDELKKLFHLHHPMYLPRLKKMEEIVFALQKEQPVCSTWICGRCDRDRLQCHCSGSDCESDD